MKPFLMLFVAVLTLAVVQGHYRLRVNTSVMALVLEPVNEVESRQGP